MSRVKLFIGLQFWLKGREYTIKQRLTDGSFQMCDVVTENVSCISQTDLIQLFFKDELEFENIQATTKANKKNYCGADFTQIPLDLKQEALRREQYILAVLEKNDSRRTKEFLCPIIEEISQKINDSHPPSHITLYRWLKGYEYSGKDIRSLVPNYRGRGDYRSKLQAEVNEIVEKAVKKIYLTPFRASVDAVYDEVVASLEQENKFREEIGLEKLKIPHRTTIYRSIYKLEPYEKVKARYGSKVADKMYTASQESLRVTRPLERVEIDHTKLPFFVVDEETRLPIGTPALTSAIDKYSGVVVGYYLSFEPFSSLSVMQCLLNAIRPKDYVKRQFPQVEHHWTSYGLMETLVVDNGKEFYSEHFKDACSELQIHIQYTPPKMPWYKAGVERFFGMLNTKILVGQPGHFLLEFTQQYDYDPKKNAVVSFDALQEMIHIFIIDIHNQDAHPEFKCPRSEVWEKALLEYPPALPPSHKELRVLLGRIEKRVISIKGIEFEGLYYNSAELVQLRADFEKSDKKSSSSKRFRAKATIKIDPLDLSSIYVFDPTCDNFIAIPAVSYAYTQGLSLWQHKVIKNLAAIEYKKVDIVALALAKKKIQEIVEREWLLTKKGKTRSAMARWKGIGREGFNRDKPENPITPTTLTTSINHLIEDESNNSSMAGISDIGSAFNLSESSQINEKDTDNSSFEVELNQELYLNSTDVNLKIPKKRKHTRKQQSLSQVEQTVSINDKAADEWKPDLSGWDISIGLPNSEI
ncbi:MAG: DDE-type integrase/transposase/recombinase [Nostoc sp.]|uniref:Mu transposase C-terminal domain-containing protein n=1 Tax=Nostoc sp. TaxID=1180 RepID=UPI002FF89A71